MTLEGDLFQSKIGEEGLRMKKPHDSGPTTQGSISAQQFCECWSAKKVLKSKSEADRHVYMKDGTIVRIKNFVQDGSRFFLVGRSFLNIKNFFSSPFESARLTIFKVSLLKTSDLLQWDVSSVKCKALLLPICIGSYKKISFGTRFR